MLLLKYSKNCCCFPPHNLWLYEGQHFSLIYLWKNLEQVDCWERWDSAPPLELRVRVNCPFIFSIHCCYFANWLPSPSRPYYIQLSLLFFGFFLVLLSPHFPVCISSVIMWSFIWLIKASSFWEISQRTWIKLPYHWTGAMLGSASQACSALCELWKVLISFWEILMNWFIHYPNSSSSWLMHRFAKVCILATVSTSLTIT